MTDEVRDIARTILTRSRWFCHDALRRLQIETCCERLIDGSANRENTVTSAIELLLGCKNREAKQLTSRLAWAAYGDGWPCRVEEIRNDIRRGSKVA